MLPPSDSINHHNLKLAEFVANLQNQVTMPAPPPPYAARPSNMSNEELLGQIDDVEDDAGLPAPIVIKIDTSIQVDGDANTIAIPSSLSSGQDDSQSSPTTENAPTTPYSPNVQQLQMQRQTKSAQLATSIISGLRASGAMEDEETGRQRPIEISVNAGIRVKGNRNIVCANMRRPIQSRSTSVSSSRKRRAVSEPLEESASKKVSR